MTFDVPVVPKRSALSALRGAARAATRRADTRGVTRFLRPRHTLGVAAIAVSAQLLATAAHADPSPTDRAAATALFNEARRLMEQKNYAEACAKFEGSQRLDPGGGTLLNMATCHEKLGKIATAWEEFNEGLSVAIKDNRPERQSLARERIAQLEPRLPRLTIKVPSDVPRGYDLQIDGASMARGALGVPAPINPGEHVVTATAPRFLAYTEKIRLAERESKNVDVPPLAADPSAPPIPTTTTTSTVLVEPVEGEGREGHGSLRGIGIATTVVGGVALVVGTVFGALAVKQWNDSNNGCPQNHCTSQGASSSSDALSSAHAADGFLIGGGVVVGAGVIDDAPRRRLLAQAGDLAQRGLERCAGEKWWLALGLGSLVTKVGLE